MHLLQSRLIKATVLLSLCAALAGCAATDARPDADEIANGLKQQLTSQTDHRITDSELECSANLVAKSEMSNQDVALVAAGRGSDIAGSSENDQILDDVFDNCFP